MDVKISSDIASSCKTFPPWCIIQFARFKTGARWLSPFPGEVTKSGLSVKQGERNLCSYFNPLWQAHTRSAHLPNFYFALEHEHSLLGSYFQPVGGRAGVSRSRSCCWLPDALHIWLIVGNILTHLTIYIPVFNGWALIIATCVMLLIAWCVHFFRLVGVLIWPDAYFANLWHNFMPPLKLAGVLMWKGAYFAYLLEHHWNIFYAIACSLCAYFKPVVGGVLVWRESSQTRCSTGGLLAITIMSITMLEGASSKVKVNS